MSEILFPLEFLMDLFMGLPLIVQILWGCVIMGLAFAYMMDTESVL